MGSVAAGVEVEEVEAAPTRALTSCGWGIHVLGCHDMDVRFMFRLATLLILLDLGAVKETIRGREVRVES